MSPLDEQKTLYQKKALIVDDNLINLCLLANGLFNFGLVACFADNNIQAFNMLKEEHCSLVFINVKMHKLNGYDMSQKIHQEIGTNRRIIALTNNATEEEKQMCLGCGMSDYLAMPAHETEMIAVIGRNLVSNKTNDGDNQTKTNDPFINKGMVSINELVALSRGSSDFIREMIEIFLKQTPQDIKTLEIALENRDYIALGRIVHRMKTSVGFMGLKPLEYPLNRAELLCANKTGLMEIGLIVKYLKLGCELADVELKEILISIGN